jgi:predicted Zn-dependent protease with MMP-like domain
VLAVASVAAYLSLMTRRFGTAISLAEMEDLGLAALERLPAAFRAELGDVVFQVEDFADAETLAEMGIEDPFELTGLYEGHALTERSIELSGALPTRIRLFRRPILDEWAERGDETLEHLVAHVVIHEVGHHFGLSDEAMHALENGES